MPKISFKSMAAAAALGLLTASGASLYANEPVGVVRVGGGTVVHNGGTVYSDNCECEGGGQKHHHLPFAAMIHPNGTTYSPGHGFRRPEVVHIQRSPVEYRRYWPSKWYGEPGSGIDNRFVYPMVYTPTDTTQLGYYYQRVPTWRPNPAMIPPRPWPSQWHRREVGPMGMGYGTYNNVISTEPVPATSPAPMPAAPQQVTPTVPSQPVVPPAPPAVPPAPQASVGPEEDLGT